MIISVGKIHHIHNSNQIHVFIKSDHICIHIRIQISSHFWHHKLWRTGFYSVNRTHKYCVTFFSSFYLSFIYRIKQQNNISRPPWCPSDLPGHVLHALLPWLRETATARWPPTSRGQVQPTITTSHNVTLIIIKMTIRECHCSSIVPLEWNLCSKYIYACKR